MKLPCFPILLSLVLINVQGCLGRSITDPGSSFETLLEAFKEESRVRRSDALDTQRLANIKWCQTPGGAFQVVTLVTAKNGSDLSGLWGTMADDPHQRYSLFVLCWDKSVPCHYDGGKADKILYVPNENLVPSEQTWASNRNLLFEFAQRVEQEQGCVFQYYLFADADVDLVSAKERHLFTHAFHHMLLEDRPALATSNNPWMVLPGIDKKAAPFRVLPVAYYDHNFVAVHYNASRWLLPYFTSWDKISWWWSGYVMNMQTLIHYLPNVRVLWEHPTNNTLHEKNDRYKRGMIKSAQWGILVSAIGENLYHLKCQKIPLMIHSPTQYTWRLQEFDVWDKIVSCDSYAMLNATCIESNMRLLSKGGASCVRNNVV